VVGSVDEKTLSKMEPWGISRLWSGYAQSSCVSGEIGYYYQGSIAFVVEIVVELKLTIAAPGQNSCGQGCF